MALPNIFSKEVSDKMIERINNLTPTTAAKWGKMNVAQMIAHCNVTYELSFEKNRPKPSAFNKLILKLFVKKLVTNEAPYKKNSQTGPQFIIKDTKNFETEKQRLVDYINKTQQMGEAQFENREQVAFGVLTKTEWNNMFYKHLDHHLSQFGV